MKRRENKPRKLVSLRLPNLNILRRKQKNKLSNLQKFDERRKKQDFLLKSPWTRGKFKKKEIF